MGDEQRADRFAGEDSRQVARLLAAGDDDIFAGGGGDAGRFNLLAMPPLLKPVALSRASDQIDSSSGVTVE